MKSPLFPLGSTVKVVSKSTYKDTATTWPGDEHLGKTYVVHGVTLDDDNTSFLYDLKDSSDCLYTFKEEALEEAQEEPQKPVFTEEYKKLIADLRALNHDRLAGFLENKAWKYSWFTLDIDELRHRLQMFLSPRWGYILEEVDEYRTQSWRCLLQEVVERYNKAPHRHTVEEALKGIEPGVCVKVVSCYIDDNNESSLTKEYLGETFVVSRVVEVLLGKRRHWRVAINDGLWFDPRHLEVVPYEPKWGDIVEHPRYGRGVMVTRGYSYIALFKGGNDAHPRDVKPTGKNIADV